MNLGKILYGLRTHKKLTQPQLAEKAHVSVQTIGKIENDPEYRPSYYTMDLIAKALECPTPMIYMYSMESTDCHNHQQTMTFLGLKPTISQMLDLIYNLPKNQ